MFVYFKLHLTDGSQRTHYYDLGEIDKEQFRKKMREWTNGIEARLEASRSLPMPHPNTIYAAGQVKYVEISFAKDAKGLEESTAEEFKRKMGFIKE